MKTLKKILSYILSLLLGAGSVMCVIPWVTKNFADNSFLKFELAILLAIIPVCITGLIMIAAHEAGHLIAGLLSGYKFVSYRVLSFTLIKLDGKLCLRRFKLSGTSGQCLLKPPAWTDKGIPVTLYNMGGILMNAALMLVFLIPACIVPVDSFGGMLILSAAFLNGWFMLMNGLPLSVNDGDNVLHLSKDLSAQKAFWAQMMGNAMLSEGIRTEDFPKDFYKTDKDADMTNPIILESAAIQAQLDIWQGRTQEGETECRQLLSNPAMPPILKFILTYELICLELMKGNDASSLITKEFDRFRKAMRTYPDVIRTEYIIALSKGDTKAAAKHRHAMEKVAKTYHYKQDIDSQYRFMAEADALFGGKQ